METNFVLALKEGNDRAILDAPKSDIHSHAGRGGHPSWIAKRLQVSIADPPNRFQSLDHMQKWYEENIKVICPGKAGHILRWEAAFAEAGRNHIKRLALSFSTSEVEFVGGMEAFMGLLNEFKGRYCKETKFQPELAYASYCNPLEESKKMEKYLDFGYFKSIDINCGEGIQPFKAYLPLYEKAHEYGLRKKMHVGETGTAEDVLEAIDVLGLDEIHHGIAAATSKSVMKVLRDRNIQLNVCPTSNVLLGIVESYEKHPIKVLVENEVPVTINTDDLLIFGQSIDKEYIHLFKSGTLTAEELDKIRLRGLEG